MKKLLKLLGRILALCLALLLILALVMIVVPLTETGDKTPVPGSADWMAALPDDRLLSEIVIPGTHDSGTQYVQLAFFSKCQSMDIAQQLEAGFRYLDIRLGAQEHDQGFLLMHGFTKCRTGAFSSEILILDAVLNDCYRFLDAQPTETVLCAGKQEHGEESVTVFENMLDACIRDNEDHWLLTDSIPTLGDARGKLVLLRRYADEAGLGSRAGIPFLWANQNGHDDVSKNAAAEENGYTLYVQDRYEYGTEDKWKAFTAGMDAGRGRGAEDISLSFLSTKGTLAYGHPWHFAKDLNERLLQANLALDGWVIVDFASSPLAERIYSANP